MHRLMSECARESCRRGGCFCGADGFAKAGRPGCCVDWCMSMSVSGCPFGALVSVVRKCLPVGCRSAGLRIQSESGVAGHGEHAAVAFVLQEGGRAQDVDPGASGGLCGGPMPRLLPASSVGAEGPEACGHLAGGLAPRDSGRFQQEQTGSVTFTIVRAEAFGVVQHAPSPCRATHGLGGCNSRPVL
jgi:hypothetical protein